MQLVGQTSQSRVCETGLAAATQTTQKKLDISSKFTFSKEQRAAGCTAAGAAGAADGLFKSVLYVQQLSAQLDQQVADPATVSWVKAALMPQFVEAAARAAAAQVPAVHLLPVSACCTFADQQLVQSCGDASHANSTDYIPNTRTVLQSGAQDTPTRHTHSQHGILN